MISFNNQYNTTEYNKSVIRHLLLGQCYLRHIHFEKTKGVSQPLKHRNCMTTNVSIY